MKVTLPVILFFALCLSPALAETAPKAVELPTTARLPGVDLGEGLAQITGVAISPLLGVSAMGAWKYYYTPEVRRAQLPWFCRPYVWITTFCLLGLCFLKDFFGTAAPPLVKKPLDVAELFESKLSALVACSACVPFIVSQVGRQAPLETSFLLGPTARFSSFLAVATFDVRFLTIPLAIVAFLTVWLACHAINVLIALCPFGFVDAILKVLKASLLGSVVVASLIHPYLGGAVSLVILVIAGLLAPWAFRLTVFGTLFGLDVLLPSRGRQSIRTTEPHAFLGRKVADTPVRTYGRLTRARDGSVTFTYRPWLLFPDRSVALPPGNVAITRGVLFPSLLQGVDQQRKRIVIMFLPRYRSHEQAIASHFEIVDVQDSTLIKGFKAVRTWLADTVNLGRAKYEQVRRNIEEGGVASR
jgi:hypothetical protein